MDASPSTCEREEARTGAIFWGGKTFSQIFLVGTWRGAGFLLGMVTNIVLVRQLGASDYGVLAVALAVITLFASVVGEALDLAMLRSISLKKCDNPGSEGDALGVSLVLKVLAVMLIACPILLAGYYGASSLMPKQPEAGYLVLITACLLGTVLARSFATFYQATEQFSKYLWTELTQTASKFCAVGLLLGSGLLTAFNALCAFAVVPFVTIAMVSRWRPRSGMLNFEQARRMSSSLLGFAKWVALSYAIAATHSRVDTLLLSYFRESQEVGQYAAAQTMAFVPEILVGFLCGALMPKIMPLWESGRFAQYLMTFIRYAAPLCIVGCLAIWFLGPQVIRLVYGEVYEQSIALFQILAAGSLVWCVALPLAIPLVCMQKPRWEIVLNVLVLIFTVVGSILVIPQYGTVGTAILVTGIKVIVAGVSLWLAFRVSDAAVVYRSPVPAQS